MKPRTLRRATTGIAALGLLGGSTLVGFGPSTLAGAALPDGETFSFTGEAQTWVVPDGVCEVDIVALGAAGGAGVNVQEGPDRAAPGRGGSAAVTIDVTPGEELQVNVGGRGGDGTPGNDLVPTPGGWNGGGDVDAAFAHSGGGGGASDVRRGGTDLDSRVVVGAGGGGSAFIIDDDVAPLSIGGDGGNPATAGGDGATVPFGMYDPARGGGAASGTAGGVGGAGMTDGLDHAEPGGDGTLGQGGVGGGLGDGAFEVGSGGGGGGGLYGGGGGGANGDAGAGGGGGSSLGDSTEAGVNDGDGEVTITPSGDCDTDIPDEPTTTTPGEQPNDGGQARPATPVTARPAYTG